MSTFVFIGRNLDKDYLIKGFEKCTIEDKLRFKVGDKVLANMDDTWEEGIIIQLWDEGQPYRIKLSKGIYQDLEVFGSIDDDECVRAP